jgi:hypothetical protein
MTWALPRARPGDTARPRSSRICLSSPCHTVMAQVDPVGKFVPAPVTTLRDKAPCSANLGFSPPFPRASESQEFAIHRTTARAAPANSVLLVAKSYSAGWQQLPTIMPRLLLGRVNRCGGCAASAPDLCYRTAYRRNEHWRNRSDVSRKSLQDPATPASRLIAARSAGSGSRNILATLLTDAAEARQRSS